MAPFAGVQRQIVELGCACVARTRGSLAVMELLWRGIAFYARTHQARYVITCSSLQTQDRRLGASLYASLYRTHLVQSELRTQPLPGRAWPLTELADEIPPLPVPLAAHLALGSRICGPPALNSRFDTMDFLTVLDFENLSRGALELGVRWPAVDKSNQPSRSEARPDLA
jgi:putative hemolysin